MIIEFTNKATGLKGFIEGVHTCSAIGECRILYYNLISSPELCYRLDLSKYEISISNR